MSTIKIDEEKQQRYQAKMREAGLDALLIRYPENVVYFANYYPITGWASCIIYAEEDPILLVPDTEVRFTSRRIIKHMEEYTPDGNEKLIQEYEKYDLDGLTIGIEAGFESIASTNLHYEVAFPNKPFFSALAHAFPDAEFWDAADLIYELREYKTEMEMENYRFLNNVQSIGLQAAADALTESQTEMKLATITEAAIQNAIEQYPDEIQQIRALAFVMGGKNGQNACWPYNISTAYKMKPGEWCMMELNTQINGYWSDLTRTWVVGRNPTEDQQHKAEVLNGAIEKAVGAMKEGISMNALDQASRTYIEENGLLEYHTPFLGHGIGVKLHEPYPLAFPGAEGTLKKGHFMTIEPGLYFPEGALRFERMVYLRADNTPEITDPFPCEL